MLPIRFTWNIDNPTNLWVQNCTIMLFLQSKCWKSRYICGGILPRYLCTRMIYKEFHVWPKQSQYQNLRLKFKCLSLGLKIGYQEVKVSVSVSKFDTIIKSPILNFYDLGMNHIETGIWDGWLIGFNISFLSKWPSL